MTTVRPGEAVRHERGDPGTIGAIVHSAQNPADRFLLSCAHVLAPPTSNPSVGDGILNVAGTRVASLVVWTPLRFGVAHPNVVDAALARIQNGVEVDPGIRGVGLPTGVGNFVVDGMTVLLKGKDDPGLTTGTVERAGPDVRYEALYSGPAGDMVFGFRDVVECSRFTQPGDSGALVLNRRGRAVGLHFHGAEHSVFCRMVHVLDALEAELGLALELETEERHVDLVGLASGTQPLPLPPPVPTAGPEDAVDILARTLWGEARGELSSEGVKAYEAIAEAVINRTARRRSDGSPWWWGGDVVSVCRHPFQFSCWNANDPNLPQLIAVGPANHAFRVAKNVAARFVDGQPTNHTGGATHYYSVAISEPSWAREGQFTVQIGVHRFYTGAD